MTPIKPWGRDVLRSKLRAALQQKGLDATRVSLEAGLNRAFLTQFLQGRSGSKDQNLERICKTIGLRWAWLKDDEGPQWEQESSTWQLPDRESLLSLLEGVFLYLSPDMLESDYRAAAEALLAIVESQPVGMSDDYRRSKIHNEIRGALLVLLRR